MNFKLNKICAQCNFSDAVEPEMTVYNNNSEICPGKNVTLTCETRGTDRSTWIINVGSNLSYQTNVTATSEEGRPRSITFNDNIIIVNIMLVETSVKNSFTVLNTLLNITMLQRPGPKNLSVTCQNNELSTSTSVILLVGGPGTSHGQK